MGDAGAAAAHLNLRYILPLGRGAHGVVFKAQSQQASVVAVKCVRVEQAAQQRRAEREHQLACLAAKLGVGPPVLRTERTSTEACMVMACAATDLRALLARAHHFRLHEMRRFWGDAFALVVDRRLCARRLICSDLKPANVLVFDSSDPHRTTRAGGVPLPASSSVELRLNDFDPVFWKQAVGASHLAAAAFNAFALLSNSVVLHGRCAGYLPDAAIDLLAHARRGELADVIERHELLCRRGLYHYAGLECSSSPRLDLIARLQSVVGLRRSRRDLASVIDDLRHTKGGQ